MARKRSQRQKSATAHDFHKSYDERQRDEEAHRQAASEFREAELEKAANVPQGFAKSLHFQASAMQIAALFAAFGVDKRNIHPVGKVRFELDHVNTGRATVLFPDLDSLNRCIQASKNKRLILRGMNVQLTHDPPKSGERIDHRCSKMIVPATRISVGSWDGLDCAVYHKLWAPRVSGANKIQVALSPMLRMLSVCFQEDGCRPVRLSLKVNSIVGYAHLQQLDPQDFILTISFSRPPFASRQRSSTLDGMFSEASLSVWGITDAAATAVDLNDTALAWERVCNIPALAHSNALQLHLKQFPEDDKVHKLLTMLSKLHARPGGQCAIQPDARLPMQTIPLPDITWQPADLSLGFRALCAIDRMRSSFFGTHSEKTFIQPLISAAKAVVSGNVPIDVFAGVNLMLACTPMERMQTVGSALEEMAMTVAPIGNRLLRHQTVDKMLARFHELFLEHLESGEAVGSSSNSSVSIRRVLVTPSRILHRAQEAESANRAIRSVALMINQPLHIVQDLFIRVTFADENMSAHITSDANGEYSLDSLDPLYQRIKAILKDGLLVGGRKYRFLGWSSAMLREHAVWMFADPATAGFDAHSISTDQLRRHLGDFSGIHVVAKWAARLAQCFSATIATNELPRSNIRYVADINTVGQGGKEYVFSDGVGTMSLQRARLMYADYLRHIGKGRRAKKDTSEMLPPDLPSAFQVRFAGAKGVLSIDTRLTGLEICLRPSMKKFESNDRTVEVCKITRRSPYFLNRQIITLLNTLQVNDDAIMKLLEDNLSLLVRAAVDSSVARELLLCGSANASGGITSAALSDALSAGFDVSTEPFLHALLRTIMVSRMSDLRERARIQVPKAAVLMGVMDEWGLLRSGEVFFAVTSELFDNRLEATAGSTFPAIAIDVMVTRCPCFHPGDLRFLRAVTLNDLLLRAGRCSATDISNIESYYSCLRDVLVFPHQGQRPHTNEMSGGDLDGDEYFITWEPSLFPLPHLRNTPAMDFSSTVQPETKPNVCEYDVQRFFVHFLQSDNLGILANRHLALADQSEQMAFDPRCVLLANLHSTAVDFQKTGIAADFSAHGELLRAHKMPDFMENKSKSAYKSTKALGKAYRKVLEVSEVAKKSILKQNIRADPSLSISGRDEYFPEAVRVYRNYTHDLIVLMNKFGVLLEEEAFSGHVARFREKLYARKKPQEAQEMLVREMHNLRRKYRQEVFLQVVSADEDGFEDSLLDYEYERLTIHQQQEVAKIVSAYYAVAYEPPDEEGDPRYLSLPWLFPEVLADIKGARR